MKWNSYPNTSKPIILSVIIYIIIKFKIINNILLSSAKWSSQIINIMEKIDYLKNDYPLICRAGKFIC